MSDSTEKTKQVRLRLPNKDFYDIEDYAQKHNLNRSQAIIDLIHRGLDGDTSEPATKSDLETIVAKLDGLANGQDAIKSAQQANATAIAAAIREQPIAAFQAQTQPQELPAPKKKSRIREFFSLNNKEE